MSRFAILALFSLSLFFFFFFTSPQPIAAADDGAVTAYDLLQSYGFPAGLLPKGVSGYDMDNTTGRFKVYLNGSCSFSLEGSYQLRYKSTIGGHISKERITELNGVSVKVLFLWLNIIEIDRSGNDLEFSVGIASADFSVDNFEESPQCGCGLNCNSNGQSIFQVVFWKMLKFDNPFKSL